MQQHDCELNKLTTAQPLISLAAHFQVYLKYLRRLSFPVLSKLPVYYKYLTHILTVFALGTAFFRSYEPLTKAFRVAMTDLLSSKYAQTENPRCGPIQTTIATKMGLTTDHNKTLFIHPPPPQLECYYFQTA